MKSGGEGGIGFACLAALGSNPRVLIRRKTVREGFENLDFTERNLVLFVFAAFSQHYFHAN